MKVYCIHPGASWSTSDVYTGLVAGVRAQPGVDLHEGRIDTILNWYDTAIHLGVQAGVWTPDAYKTSVLNRQRMASAHITQDILDVWPDVVISVSGHNYHLADADILRRVGIKTAVILTESPYFGDLEREIARHYDVAFTNERTSAARLNAHYLPHAYNPAVHTPEGTRAYAADVIFIGSLFDERRALFNAADWWGVDFLWRGHDMSETPSDVVPNTEAAAYYRAAKIGLNHHRTTTSHGSGQHIRPEEAESLGPRAYEIPACGAFQLMDDSRVEARDVFGDWLATYKAGDADDLSTQVRYWLAHPDRRDETARAQHAAILPHAWDVRARQVVEKVA
jgi:spore maturation protein CgeB